jgi:hypothetical protein
VVPVESKRCDQLKISDLRFPKFNVDSQRQNPGSDPDVLSGKLTLNSLVWGLEILSFFRKFADWVL